jgi:hypothetical protein
VNRLVNGIANVATFILPSFLNTWRLLRPRNLPHQSSHQHAQMLTMPVLSVFYLFVRCERSRTHDAFPLETSTHSSRPPSLEGSRQSCMTPGTIGPSICSWPIRALVKPRPYATYKKGLADDPFELGWLQKTLKMNRRWVTSSLAL